MAGTVPSVRAPIAPAPLHTILKQVDDTTPVLFSVVDDHFVDALVQATRSVLPDPLTPKTGIGFVIDVDRVFGMEP